MSRIHATTTPSGDEVTLEVTAQVRTRPRALAQVEHNAMQALDLVRSTLTALSEVTRSLDRAALLLSHSHGGTETAVWPELARVIEQLGTQIESAELHGEPILQGGQAAFALRDPSDELTEPVQVELPNLSHDWRELAAHAADGAAQLTERHAVLSRHVQAARRRLANQAKRLSEVLSAERRQAPAPAAARRLDDERFVAMTQQVRDSVLHAGDAALLVQGTPSTRAAWLVEASHLAS